MKLIIVESPAKARTIERFLGKDYQVAASYGHIRDLPGKAAEIPDKVRGKSWARLGVDVDDDFQPVYIVPSDSKKHVTSLKALLAKADELLLATDEDREGEAISWHLLEVLKPKIPVRRITFHEITRGAIADALANPREVDTRLVRAQESRRILDRLYGYSLSPVLWKKVRTKLSAGRVQSVAVRLVVEREEERQRFRAAEYHDVEADLVGPGAVPFTARLVEVDAIKLATGKDFDPETGLLKAEGQRLQLDAARAAAIEAGAGAPAALPWRVADVRRKETRQRPLPPFTTSTLQQAGSNALKLTPNRLMQIAQRLYEGEDLGGGERVGLITYMRTDSLTLSEKALAESQSFIHDHFGPEYTDGPRRYRTQSKGAQEAHEAIRPTSFDRTPDSLQGVLAPQDLAVYRLIWNRALASQMTDAVLDQTAIDLACRAAGSDLLFRATGSIVRFPGWKKVAGGLDRDELLPDLAAGAVIPSSSARQESLSPADAEGVKAVRAVRHETQPPARYTEATLIKKLEEEGIGRPSTYAPIIETIQNREYVVKKGGALLPTYVGMAIVHLLRDHFRRYVDLRFTAAMEEQLDEIAEGEVDHLDFLRAFYRGRAGEPGLVQAIEDELPRIEYPAVPVGDDPVSGQPIHVRIGRNFVYVQIGDDDDLRATLPVDLLIDELTPQKAHDFVAQRQKAQEPIGRHPETGENIYARTGPFGPYLQLGDDDPEHKPKRVSLGRGTDPAHLDLAHALRLLSLPREIGVDPDSGKPVRAGLGRFGPYVECNRVYASVASAEELFEITLVDALERIRNKNKRPVLRDLGPHPETGAPLQIFAGRYGPYVTDGVYNATLARGSEPDDLTVADALTLLTAAAARGKPARRGRRAGTFGAKKTAPRKTASKKTAAKKTATKKTVTKKTVTKKKATKKTAKKKATPGTSGAAGAKGSTP